MTCLTHSPTHPPPPAAAHMTAASPHLCPLCSLLQALLCLYLCPCQWQKRVSNACGGLCTGSNDSRPGLVSACSSLFPPPSSLLRLMNGQTSKRPNERQLDPDKVFAACQSFLVRPQILPRPHNPCYSSSSCPPPHCSVCVPFRSSHSSPSVLSHFARALVNQAANNE